MSAHLTRLLPDGGQETIPLSRSPFFIGSDTRCDLAVAEAGLSPKHCKLFRRSGDFVVADQRSRTGLVVNGTPTTEQALVEGDVLQIGEAVFIFHPAPSGVAAAAGFRLTEIVVEGAARHLDLGAEPATLGRDPRSSLRILDDKGSGAHCRIERRGVGHVVGDLGSTNGTFVNGLRVDEAALAHGDELLVGETRFVYHDRYRPLPPALSGERFLLLHLRQGKQERFLLAGTRATLGSAGADTFKVSASLGVEGGHLEFLRQGRAWVVRVAPGLPPVRIGGVDSTQRVLAHGDDLRLGECHLIYLNEALPAERYFLTFLDGPLGGTDFQLEGERISIGRLGSADLCLTEGAVSNHHARITVDGGRFQILDLGSENGTLVNGKPVAAPSTLEHGDRIEIGDNTLIFRSEQRVRPEILTKERFSLIPLEGKGKKKGRASVGPFAIRKEIVSIGRDSGNDLIVGGRKSSAYHARIEARPDGFVVVDLDSTNGTHVNGRTVRGEAPLAHGDVVRIGPARFVFKSNLRTADVGLDRNFGWAIAAAAGIVLPFLLVIGYIAFGGTKPEADAGPVAEGTDDDASMRARSARLYQIEQDVAGVLRDLDHERMGEAVEGIGVLLDREAGPRSLEEAAPYRVAPDLDGAWVLTDILRQSLPATDDEARTIVRQIAVRLEDRAEAVLRSAETEAQRRLDDGDIAGAREVWASSLDAVAEMPQASVVRERMAALDRVEAALAGAEPEAGADPDRPEAVGPARLGRLEIDLVEKQIVGHLTRLDVEAALAASRNALDRVGNDSPEERRARWWLEGVAWEPKLRAALREAVGRRTLVLDLAGRETEVAAADDEGLDLSLGGQGSVRRAWSQLAVADYLVLLEQIRPDLGDDWIEVAGAMVRRGRDVEAMGVLVELHAKGGADRRRAARFLTAWRGLDGVPEGGFAVVEGVLVSQAEKAAVEEGRQADETESAEALARIESGSAADRKADAILAHARGLMARGKYVLGHQVLRGWVERYPDHPEREAVLPRTRANAVLHDRLVHDSGPGENRIDVVVAGDGYLLHDYRQRAFGQVAERVVQSFLKTEPLREYAAYFNYRVLHCASEEEEVSTPGEEHSSLFKARVSGPGGQCFVDRVTSRRVLDEAVPGWDTALIMVRHGTLGMGGGDLCAFAEGGVDVALHEFGHAFADLRDEYTISSQGLAPSEEQAETGANLVASKDLETCPWRHWIEAGARGIGFHEGGGGRVEGVWRPSSSGCLMNQGSAYCIVCREAVVLEIYQRVRPVDRAAPDPSSTLSVGPSEQVVLRLDVLKPATHNLVVQWKLAGRPLGRGVSPLRRDRQTGAWYFEARLASATLFASGTAVEVEATVHDPTPWVGSDPEGRLSQTVVWRLEAVAGD